MGVAFCSPNSNPQLISVVVRAKMKYHFVGYVSNLVFIAHSTSIEFNPFALFGHSSSSNALKMLIGQEQLTNRLLRHVEIYDC